MFEIPHQKPPLAVVAARRPVLGEARMQENRVRHDGRADDPDCERHRAGVRQAWNHGAEPRRGPVDRGDDHLDEIAKGDRGDERADDQFGRAEAAALEHQDAVGEDARDAHAGEQRDMQQERKADRAAEEFGEVRRHRRDLADDPQRPDHWFWETLAAEFGQIASGDDAELGRQRLEQHRRHAGRQHHPQEGVAVFRPGPDVGGEIAGVHIGDRSDHRGARKQERAAPSRFAGERVANALDRPVRHPHGRA